MKLREKRGLGRLSGQMAAVSRPVRSPQGAGMQDWPKTGSEGRHRGRGRQNGHAANRARITSYNVCYTKLLRQECVLEIRRAADKAGAIIEALLLLAGVRLASGVEFGPVDMAHVVDEAINRVDDRLILAGPEIVLPEHWPEAWGYGSVITSYSIHYTKLYEIFLHSSISPSHPE